MPDLKKRVLIVDDDEILRHGMRILLQNAEFIIDEASNGKEALAILATQAIDLIVSDFEMPIMDGIQLLQRVKDQHDCRFILISEFSSALQARQAHQLGADEFLNKTFGREDFVKAVNSALNDNADHIALEDEYIQVPLTEFITGTVLLVDLFVRISSKKYIKIGNKGGTLDKDRIESYMSKGLKWLYMRKADFATYVGLNITLAQQAHGETRIECKRKIRLVMHVTETLIDQLRTMGVDRQRLENTSNVVMNAVELILSSYDTMKLLESIEEQGTLPEHSIAVGIWSCLIAKELSWKGHSTFFKIAVCSLFHDIGNKELDAALLQKQRFELDRNEIKSLESHTTRGRDILQSVPGMIEDAATVALQHHELYRGGGYPLGMKMHQIHPLALLIGMADRLCEFIKSADKENAIQTAFEKIKVVQKDFDPEHFKALQRVMEQAKPKPIRMQAS